MEQAYPSVAGRSTLITEFSVKHNPSPSTPAEHSCQKSIGESPKSLFVTSDSRFMDDDDNDDDDDVDDYYYYYSPQYKRAASEKKKTSSSHQLFFAAAETAQNSITISHLQYGFCFHHFWMNFPFSSPISEPL